MANRSAKGFIPIGMMGGGDIPLALYPVDSSSSTATYIGDVMCNNSAGSVRPAAADAGVTACGVCVGVYDSNKIPCGHPSSSVSTKYLTGSVAGYCLVALALPNALFRAQCSATLSASDINATLDHVAGTGSTVTGHSGHYLNGTTLNTEAQCRIIGLYDEPNNAWGANQDIVVSFNESMWGQTNPTVGV